MAALDLHTVDARETAGAATTSRFRYQANLALIRACELHTKGEPYAVIVEYFDDITLFEEQNEKPLTFIQAKGKMSGSWSIAALAKQAKDKPSPNSIIGKLYSNVPNFPDHTARLEFVTNATFNAKLADGSSVPSDTSEIHVSLLHETELEKISKSLSEDFSEPRSPDCKDLLILRRVALDVKDQDTFVIGRLVQLTDDLGLSGVPHTALYKTLFSDISAKSAAVIVPTSSDDLIKKKALTRDDFSKVLAKAATAHRFEDFKPLLISELKVEDQSSLQIMRLISRCHSFIANRSLGRPLENLLSEKLRRAIQSGEVNLDTESTFLGAADRLIKNLEDHDFPSEMILPAALVQISESEYV